VKDNARRRTGFTERLRRISAEEGPKMSLERPEEGEDMSDKANDMKKISMSSSKKEMLDAYNEMVERLQGAGVSEAVQRGKVIAVKRQGSEESSASFTYEAIINDIAVLKIDVGKMLTVLLEKLEEKVCLLGQIEKSIEIKQRELKELFDIKNTGVVLAQLKEEHERRIKAFEEDVAFRKEELWKEIKEKRVEWEREAKRHETAIRERDEEEQRRREREREASDYAFQREQQLLRDQLEDEKERVRKELESMRRKAEVDLLRREQMVSEQEKELEALREKVRFFPGEVERQTAEAVGKREAELRNMEEMRVEFMSREFDVERKALRVRCEELEKRVQEQEERIERLMEQQESACRKVEDIALRAIEKGGLIRSVEGPEMAVYDSARGRGEDG